MNGVNILASAEVVTKYTFNWQAFWISILITISLLAFVGLMLYLFENCGIGIIPCLAVMGLFFGIIIGGALGLNAGIPVEYTTEYKVIISDEVNFNEFQEKYEIIDQDGRIYVVREKDKE
jgi:adenine/guanine phosphoribosyltransferase-like PRPP-binding protein